MGCPQLPLHHQFSFPKERPQDKRNEIHVSEPDEIPFLAFRTNLSVDIYNRPSQKLSNNGQCLLEGVEPGKNYRRCIWCISFSTHRVQKESTSFNPKRERPTPFSSGKWGSDSRDRTKVGIWELCEDECLDFLMSDQTRSPNQVLNDINSIERNNVAMRELPSLSELVDATKNECGYRELQPNMNG